MAIAGLQAIAVEDAGNQTCASMLKALAVPGAADVVDRECGLSARGQQQFARAPLARVIHAITDRWPQSGRVWPFVENPVRKGRKQALQLIVGSARRSGMR